MDRNSYHFSEGSAKCPLRPKEMKLDFGGGHAAHEDRLAENAPKTDERRGFRPAPKLQALHLSRGKHRTGTVAEISNTNNNNSSGGDGFGAALTTNVPLSDTPMKDNPLQGPQQRQPRRRSLEFALTASPQLRLKARAHAVRRHLRISETMPASHSRTLWVEGNSVLHQEAGVATSALAHLSECAARERQIKAEWEAARFAKVQAFRAVVKVFMMSFTDAGGAVDSRQSTSKGITDTLAMARCSVVTNALVGTIQSFARAFRSRQLGAARGTLPSPAPHFRPTTSSTDFALSFNSAYPMQSSSAEEEGSASESCLASDSLDREEVSRLRQLYFDYFDCEAVSITSVVPSNSGSAMFEANSVLDASRPSSAAFGASRPASSTLMEDLDGFCQSASKSM